MTEDAGGVSAPAEATPIADSQAVEPPNPISVDNTNPDPQPEQKPEVKAEEKADKPKSAREALKEAADKVNKDEADTAEKAKADDKPEAKSETKEVKAEKPERDETGKFKAKESAETTDKAPEQAGGSTETEKPDAEPQKAETAPHEAPSRFSQDAKAEWTKAPQSVQAEVQRAVRELEAGIQEHQKFRAPLKAFEEMAAQNNTTIAAALENYTAIDGLLERDFVKGLETLCQRKGYALSDIAAQIMGQDPDKARSETDAQMRAIANENAVLKQQVQEFKANAEKTQYDTINKEIESFKTDHPRFAELESTMARLITAGLADDISEAYQMAETFKPSQTPPVALVPAEPAPAAPAPDLTAQTQKGSKSISGAPSAGSDPVEGKPSSSIKDALKRAMAQAG